MLELSEREKEVLSLWDRGLTYKEIAAELGISVHTVKTYCQRIIVKTYCNSLRIAAYRRRSRWKEEQSKRAGVSTSRRR